MSLTHSKYFNVRCSVTARPVTQVARAGREGYGSVLEIFTCMCMCIVHLGNIGDIGDMEIRFSLGNMGNLGSSELQE